MKRLPVSHHEAQRIAELTDRLGSRTVRTVLTGEGNRIMRPERLANIYGGTGRLTPEEKQRIELLSANAQQIEWLARKGEQRGNLEWKNNRALRDWMIHGKEKGQGRRRDRERELKAIKSLRYFGINPASGRGYVRKSAK
jgi:hypothetical protein